MTFSIIIPTCNRNDLLAKCLDSLHLSALLGFESYEIIVSDDSKDNVARQLVVQHYDFAKWVEGPKKGPAANRNNGVKYATGDWLIFTDDDCLPQAGWLTAYQSAIKKNREVMVFEGRTIADRPRERFDEEAPVNLNGNNLWSCNFAINHEFFLQLGGFDESFPFASMEDIDFHIRAKALANIMFLPEALVIHPWRRIKPFTTFKKRLESHRHFAKKYGLLGKSAFRWSRFKIFAGSIFTDFKELLSYSLKGWRIYLQKCLLNFCLIFI